MIKKSKAQSILEYVIIFAAIIGAIILGARVIGNKVQGGFDKAGDVVGRATEDFSQLYTSTNWCKVLIISL